MHNYRSLSTAFISITHYLRASWLRKGWLSFLMLNEEGEISGRGPDTANCFWKRSKSGLKFRGGTKEWEGKDVYRICFQKRQGQMQVFPKIGERYYVLIFRNFPSEEGQMGQSSF